MSGAEAILFWGTILLLAAVFFMSWLSLAFKQAKPFRFAFWALTLATLTLTVFGIIRWVRSGHPPFVSLFESMITSVWFLLVILHIVRFRAPQFRIAVLPVSAVAFLLMGWASSLPKEATPLTEALTNTWLFIHASFATAGASAFLIAASLSVIYLLGQDRLESLRNTMGALPEYRRVPHTVTNFVLFGLILWGVMIVSGSIWAHIAWGRYWAWDPIELWSLIGWLLYGLLLHARLAFRLPLRTFCWLTIVAALTVAFALWGVHYIYDTIHTYG